MSVAASPRIVTPPDAASTAALLRACTDAGEAVVIAGGGTHGRGNRAVRHDVTLSTAALRGIVAYEPRDLTVAVGAGTPVAELATVLRAERQMLPFDVARPGRATIGGTLASAWSGPRRGAYGRPRDLLIGSVAALADGTLAHAGGMVVKNVTGYDLGKLFVGSYGTLGAIVQANFKVLPMPAVVRLAVSTLDDDQTARVFAHVTVLEIEPAALLTFTDGVTRRFYALFEGGAATVERGIRDLRSALGAAGVAETRLLADDAAEAAYQAVLDTAVAPFPTTALVVRIVGLPSDALAIEAAVRAAAGALPCATLTDVRNGDVIAAFASAGDAVRAAIATLRAQRLRVVVIGGAQPLLVEAFGEPPPSIGVQRAIKSQFDPRGTLAPGSFVGGL